MLDSSSFHMQIQLLNLQWWSSINIYRTEHDSSQNCTNINFKVKVKVKVKVMLRLTVGQYVLVSSSLWDLWPDIIFCLKVAVVSVGRPLWREVGSVSCQTLSVVFSPLSTIWYNLHCTCHMFYVQGAAKRPPPFQTAVTNK
jgi:hypothetical protein